MKKINKLLSMALPLFMFLFGACFFTNNVLAADGPLSGDVETNIVRQEGAFFDTSGIHYGTTIGSIVAIIIESVLGLLGIIFVVLLVYAGFMWMTANGEEEKIKKAQNTIKTAIIGLIIIIAAYSITYFVFNALNNGATTGAGMD